MSVENAIQQQIETPAAASAVFSLPCGYLAESGELHTEVVVREMTGEEEDILASNSNPMAKMNEIQSRCLVRVGEISDAHLMNGIVRDLPIGDRIYLLIAIRRVTLGDNYPFDFKCPECGASKSMSLDLSALEVKRLEDPKVRVTSIELPSGKTAEFHLATGRDEEKFSSVTGADALSKALLLRLDTICGEPATLKSVKCLSMRDRGALRKAYEVNDAGVDTEIEISCPSCLAQFKTEMEIQPSFFFPSEM